MKKGKKVRLDEGTTRFDRGNTKFDSGGTKLDSGRETEFIAQSGGSQKHPAKPSLPKEMRFIER